MTVARNEGNVSQEGDAFSAANMNDLEERIDAGFTELNGKLQVHSFGEEIDLNSYTSNAFTCPCDGYICVSTTTTSQEKQAFAYVNGKILCVARPNGIYGGYADLYVKKECIL